MALRTFCRIQLVLLSTLLTLAGCGTDTMKDTYIPRTKATERDLACAEYYRNEKALYQLVSVCAFDSDCVGANLGDNALTTCNSGQAAVNRYADLSSLLDLENEFSVACARATEISCNSPATTPKCSAAGYCYLSQ
jgi:hypothetical protein